MANRLEKNWADAEDLVQETYLRLLLGDASHIRDLLPWTSRVMKNLVIDQIRCDKRRDQFLRAWLENQRDEHSPDLLTLVEVRRACKMILWEMAETLDSHELAALLLREVFGWRYGELAVSLGKTEAATRQLVHRAIQRFRSNRGSKWRDRRTRDAELIDRIRQICTHAVFERDHDGLSALIQAPRIMAVSRPTHLDLDNGRTDKITSSIRQVGGQFAMTLVLDGVVLCVIPLGSMDETCCYDDT